MRTFTAPLILIPLQEQNTTFLKLIKDTAKEQYCTAKNIPRYGYRRCPISCCHGDQKTFENLPGNPYEYEYHEGPGVHEWVFWDEWIQHFLDTLALKGGN